MEEQNTIVVKPPFKFVSYSIWVTIGIMFIYQVVGGISAFFIPGNKAWLLSLDTGLSELILILGIAILASDASPLKRKEIFRLTHAPDMRQILFSILGLMAIQLFAAGYGVIQEYLIPPNMMKYYKQMQDLIEKTYLSILGGKSIHEFMMALTVGAVIPAISEEGLFRGFLQRHLEEKLKPWTAILLAGTIFGLIHLNPIDVIPLIVIGVYLGVLAYASKSLILPALIHFLNNAISVVAIYYFMPGKMNIDSSQIPMPTAIILCIVGFGITLAVMWHLYSSSQRQSEPVQ